MGVETQRYIRKPLYVEAVRVTAQNFDELVAWCQGEVLTGEQGGKPKKYIKVRVHHPTKNPRQTQAYVGDWLLYTEFGGYKVYTHKAFTTAFDLVEEDTPELPASDAVIEPLRAASPETVARAKEEQALAEGSAEFAEEDRAIANGEVSVGDEQLADEERPVDIEVTEHVTVGPHETPQGEPHEYVEATPKAIADAVGGHQPIEEPGSEVTPQPDPVPEQAPEDAAAGKRVLSVEEQRQMGPDAVRELIQSGEAVLAQDLAA